MRLKLTDLTIQHLKFQHPQVTYWDTMLPAFGVRVGSRSKTFIVMQGKARKRQTIGRYPAMKLQKARGHARLLLPSETGEIPAISLEHALEEYLRSLSTRTRTATEYERLLKRHFIPTLGHRRISEMVARDILAVTNKLLHTPTECRHAHVAMQTFLNWCVPRYLTASPMAGLKTPTKPNKRERILTVDELKKVWNAPQGPLTHIVRLCLLTAMRRSEAHALQPSWVQDDVLMIPAAVTKNHREHRLPITDMLRPYIAQAPFKNFNWVRAKNALDKASSVQGYVLHDLRRTAASLMAAPPVSAPPHIVERILNHVTGGTALQHLYNRYRYDAEIADVFTKYHAHLKNIFECSA
jgi:integrase